MSEWEKTTLADLCSDISYGYTESAKQEKIGPKFLRITDIASERLEWSNVPYCSISESDFEKYKLLPGDIVIARTGATTGDLLPFFGQFKSRKFGVFGTFLFCFFGRHSL